MKAAVTVQTQPDGFHCWLCLHNYSLHLHVRTPEDLQLLTRAHNTKEAGS